MTTSRTGTTAHKNFRRRVLARGKAEGVTHCPLCTVELDYAQGLKPNSAEPDHIIAIANGGSNDPSNGRVICRRCNQRRGAGPDRVVRPRPSVVASPIW